MDYSQFLYMKEELSLIAVILILFVVDLLTCPDQKGATPKVNVRSLTLPAVILMTLHTVNHLFPGLRQRLSAECISTHRCKPSSRQCST